MFLEQLEEWVVAINGFVWGWPLIGGILLLGSYLTLRLGILKFSAIKLSIKYALEKHDGVGDVSIFGSLCTALSATIGTGNIVGIAVAVTVGGPGALFWLWISSLVSFVIKYSEGLLAIKYRAVGIDGKITGGPMYYISIGLHGKKYAKPLSKIFAICGILVALIGIGTLAQSNSIATALENSFGLSTIISTVLIVGAVAAVILGGIHRIAAVSEKVVPIMTIFYIGAAIVVLLLNYEAIPSIFGMIFHGAFCPEAIFGTGCAMTISQIVSTGVSRGMFSHESGLGSCGIAAATARTDSPVKQGFVSMSGAVLSVIVCTMTGLVIIITSGKMALYSGECTLVGAQLTSQAFGLGLGIPIVGQYIVDGSVILFAITTILGWNYYGEKCTQYVFGNAAVLPYKLIFLLFVALGPFYKINIIFTLADIATGLMTFPNIIGILCHRKIIIEETRKFMGKRK
ncbi:MAG: amino acid carrier protein [Holosporales bacterium]|jgi:AGCS family alanine or glycine:cation symporter|nr:amino acid carrier protein [Holosporales bacterium]